MARKVTCSRCKGPNDRLPQRYCRTCHAASMQANRARAKVELARLVAIAKEWAEGIGKVKTKRKVARET